MGEIGALAASQQHLPPRLLERVNELAWKIPLAPEPFLIKGAVAQTEGQEGHAEQLYLAARNRDPRSRAARYFLAERYLRTGRVKLALYEFAALSRLTGLAGAAAAPALAAYARKPGAEKHLRAFFRSSFDTEQAVLAQLATDADNLDLIMALWSGRTTEAGEPADWQVRIIDALITKGKIGRAYSLWRRFAGIRAAQSPLFNSEFTKLSAPPPFNWSYGTAGGLAEPLGDGRLQIIYFGRQDTVLAQQLLLLAPGVYQLRMEATGQLKEAGEVAWSIQCLPQTRTLVRMPLRLERHSGTLQASFTVPRQGCNGQRLQLTGSPGEFSKAIEFTISKLQLTRTSG